MPIRNHRALVALAACGLMAGTVASVHAAEMGFFEALFSGGRPAPQVQQSQPDAYGAMPYRQHSRRAARQRPRIRYAALPVKIHVRERKAIDMTGGPVAALMRDETLRPGDIVVLNTGARVFTGDPDASHSLRDFEPVQTSRLVGSQTRKQLAAMMTPIGALPADEARRVMARMKKDAPRTAAPVAQQASMRVINPWTKAP
ncbi:hypothetical protein [Methylobacterium trifolii]|uniref:Uncharacterized protein n=1 Tax=Methylobacterium trifolii TaxID=1003092 RepID=A0ABQ4TZ53_9HYPH|nr:hypothetical protein [Methylobacterium trifolii]GJE59288.1 hypothetical protein MPOCJGCO_1376 [Methylobacterium trifolii]